MMDELSTQIPFLMVIMLMVVTVGIRRFGTGFLANWLGLTNEKASRLSSLIQLGVWTAFLLLVTSSRAGLFDTGSFGNVALGQFWWIFAIFGASIVWKILR